MRGDKRKRRQGVVSMCGLLSFFSCSRLLGIDKHDRMGVVSLPPLSLPSPLPYSRIHGPVRAQLEDAQDEGLACIDEQPALVSNLAAFHPIGREGGREGGREKGRKGG